MKLAFVSASILLALSGRASAQPEMIPPGTTASAALDTEAASEPVSMPAPAGADKRLDPAVAFALSFGGTAMSWGLLFGAMEINGDYRPVGRALGAAGALGIVVGPSLGNWYAGQYLTRGLGLRVGGGLLAVAGFFVAIGEHPFSLNFGGDTPDPTEPSESTETAFGAAMLVLGTAVFAAGTVDDIVSAPRRVRRLNREHEAHVSLAPLVSHRSAGLVLGGRF